MGERGQDPAETVPPLPVAIDRGVFGDHRKFATKPFVRRLPSQGPAPPGSLFTKRGRASKDASCSRGVPDQPPTRRAHERPSPRASKAWATCFPQSGLNSKHALPSMSGRAPI
jgi:hypothetical protein